MTHTDPVLEHRDELYDAPRVTEESPRTQAINWVAIRVVCTAYMLILFLDRRYHGNDGEGASVDAGNGAWAPDVSVIIIGAVFLLFVLALMAVARRVARTLP